MSREVCGICWCPYDEETGDCACPPPDVAHEALFLAKELESPLGSVISSEVDRRAAKELRRLHAELERCRKACAATSECWRADAERWAAQRYAMLEALKNIDKEFRAHGRQHWPEAVKARAAIAKAEEV